jgi:hypothetical protein
MPWSTRSDRGLESIRPPNGQLVCTRRSSTTSYVSLLLKDLAGLLVLPGLDIGKAKDQLAVVTNPECVWTIGITPG